jgi:predicted Mrr-cat superfamily restriction endonuclease
MSRLWIVRAGAHGERELAAIDQSKLFPGFLEVGDLSACADRDWLLPFKEKLDNRATNQEWFELQQAQEA